MPRPWSVANLFVALLLTFVISMGVILAGLAVYITLQSSQLHEVTRETLFESIQAELEAHYRPLRSTLESSRERFRETHEEALDRLEPLKDIEALDIRSIQDWAERRGGVPLDVYLINPDGQVVDTTYPPDKDLDFQHPALLDGRTMIERAHDRDTVIIGPPVLEVMARELRIYTYSPLGDTGYTLELGFIPGELNRQFEAIEKRLNRRDSFQAQLYFLGWDDWALSLRPDRSAGSNKTEQLDRLYQKKETLIEPLREARNDSQPVRKGGSDDPTYYVHLMDLGGEGELAMDVLAEVTLGMDPVSQTRNGLLMATVITLVLLIAVVLIVFLLMRETLAKPLSQAAAAMENWQTLTLTGRGRMVRELQLLASHYNSLLERTQSRLDGLDRRARTDALTQLANRFQIENELTVELRRSERYRELFSLIFMDVDHFKSINDDYGHLNGDRILQRMAALLEEHTRDADTVGRWGGEEFLIICRHTTLEDATRIAEALRRAIEALPIEGSGQGTASFGVTTFREGDDVESLMARADEALYRAKRGGRNCVVSSA